MAGVMIGLADPFFLNFCWYFKGHGTPIHLNNKSSISFADILYWENMWKNPLISEP